MYILPIEALLAEPKAPGGRNPYSPAPRFGNTTLQADDLRDTFPWSEGHAPSVVGLECQPSAKTSRILRGFRDDILHQIAAKIKIKLTGGLKFPVVDDILKGFDPPDCPDGDSQEALATGRSPASGASRYQPGNSAGATRTSGTERFQGFLAIFPVKRSPQH